MSPYNRTRNGSGKRADSFYQSAEWRALRAAAIRRDNARCIVCGCDVSRPGAARVDHIRPRRQFPDLALSLGNLRTLCASCDNQAHREKGSAVAGGQRVERFVVRGCRPDGSPIDGNHPWNKKV